MEQILKITKKGKNKRVFFTCDVCECEFNVHVSGVELTKDMFGCTGYRFDCPYCNHQITTFNDPVEVEEDEAT